MSRVLPGWVPRPPANGGVPTGDHGFPAGSLSITSANSALDETALGWCRRNHPGDSMYCRKSAFMTQTLLLSNVESIKSAQLDDLWQIHETSFTKVGLARETRGLVCCRDSPSMNRPIVSAIYSNEVIPSGRLSHRVPGPSPSPRVR